MIGGKNIKIGTRGSQLALWQAEWVKSQIQEIQPGVSVELEVIKTKGDRLLDAPLAKVGGKGLFVKEIEGALLEGRIDIAVHSMKDMPAVIPGGLKIGAIPKREDPADALISAGGQLFRALPENTRVGTSSLRRAAQLSALRPDLEIVPLRGNLQTRLQKMDIGLVDATVLAVAGIKRMDLMDRVSQVFGPGDMLPAVGQGALCVQTRESGMYLDSLVNPLDDLPTRMAVTAERAFLARLEGGCQVPIAALATLQDNQLTLTGMVAALDGSKIYREEISGTADNARYLGEDLADKLLDQGAGEILDALKADGL